MPALCDPNEPPAVDAAFERSMSGRAFSPRFWTDAYLAAYAHPSGLTLVTFDHGFRTFAGLACNVLEPESLTKSPPRM
jgi:predicted nucleic acid-binding protein